MSAAMTPAETERARLTRSAALASSAVALILLGLKAWAAIATGSVAMLGSLADTTLDLLASLLTLFAVGLAATPADDDHRFGHGKAEAIAALMQTLLIIGSAVAILWRAIASFGATDLPRAPEVGIGVSIAGIVLTLALVAWQKSVVKRTGSIAISTDALHYQSDLLLNSAVIIAFVIDVLLGLHGADALLGIAIALWIAWNAIRSARQALDMLMDREWPPERRARVVHQRESQHVADDHLRCTGRREHRNGDVLRDDIEQDDRNDDGPGNESLHSALTQPFFASSSRVLHAKQKRACGSASSRSNAMSSPH